MSLTKVKGIVWEANENDLHASVKEFGAKGDGTTDDTAAIQSAINTVQTAGGGTVFLPVGTYIVTDTLVIDDRAVRILGDGWAMDDEFSTSVSIHGSWIKLGDGAFNSASKEILKIIYQGDGTQPKQGVRLEKFGIFGNRSTDTASPNNSGTYNNNNTYGIGIKVEGTRNFFFSDMKVAWCAEDGIRTRTGGILGTAPGGEIHRTSSVANGGSGIDHNGGDSTFSMLNCGYNGNDGCKFNSSGSLTGMHCWDNLGDGLSIEGQNDMQVTGGYYYDNRRAGIAVGDVQRFSITGGVFQDNGQDATYSTVERAGIYVSGANAQGVIVGVVTANKDESTVTGQQYGIRVQSATAEVLIETCMEGYQGGARNGIAFISDAATWPDITIASDAITLSNIPEIQPRGESGLADDLSTINGQVSNPILLIRGNNTETITVKDGVGNINLAGGDFAMNSSADILALCQSGGQWFEISRSNNA
jgi:hypothetical protein